MSSPGEITYRQFVYKLAEQASLHSLNAQDIQRIASIFWEMMDVKFKENRRKSENRKAFWSFAQYIKNCILNRDLDLICDLWLDFNTAGKNFWENFYENSLNDYVTDIL